MQAWPCEFCDQRTGFVPADLAYQDGHGFTYALCRHHYVALVEGLHRVSERRLAARAVAVPRRAYVERPPPPPPTRPTRQERQSGPRVSGDDQRRARERVGWSLRRAAAQLGRSRAQLQGAEYGRRPVDPVVAAWVVRVLSGAEASG